VSFDNRAQAEQMIEAWDGISSDRGAKQGDDTTRRRALSEPRLISVALIFQKK
jgi:hypothetical protein